MQGGIFLLKIFKSAGEKLKDKKLIAVLLINILFLSFFLFYNFKTGLFIDDYGYMYTFSEEEKLINERIDSLGDVVRSQYVHYFTMNGRSISHAMLQTVLMFGKTTFNFVNTLFYFALSFGMYCVAKRRGKHEPLLQLLMYLVPWMLFPEYGKVFLVGCMAVNYMWTMAIITLTILPFKRLYDGRNPFEKHPLFGAVIMLPVGIISGWLSENGSAAMLFCIGCMGLYYLIARKRIPAWCVTGFVGMCAGFLIMLKAPGYVVRQNSYWSHSYMWQFKRILIYHILPYFDYIIVTLACLVCIFFFLSEKNKKKKIAVSSVIMGSAVICAVVCRVIHYDYVTEWRLAVLGIFVALCLAAAIKAIMAKKSISDHAAQLVFMLTGIIAMCIMTVVPIVEARSQIQFLVFFTYGAARIIVDFIDSFVETLSISRYKWVLTAAVTLCAAVSLASTAAASVESYEQFTAREKYIAEQKAAGVYDISVEAYDIPDDPHIGMFNMYYNYSDYWITKAMCWYYDVDSIYFQQEE